jgi:hypothetical protein
MINLNHMISILNFIFTILFYATRWIKQDPTRICFKEFLNKNLFESNFQFLTTQKSFPVFISFFFSVLARQYSFSNLSGQLVVRFNHAFGSPIQFSLVIFDLQMPVAAFSLPGHRVALHCVVHLRHSGAA